jgi:hypothetical protein
MNETFGMIQQMTFLRYMMVQIGIEYDNEAEMLFDLIVLQIDTWQYLIEQQVKLLKIDELYQKRVILRHSIYLV